MSDQPVPELDALFQRHLSSCLDEAGQRRLLALLEDAEQRDRLRRLGDLEGALVEWGAATAAEPERASPSSTRRLAVRRGRRTGIALAAMTAAAACLAVGLWRFPHGSGPAPEPAPPLCRISAGTGELLREGRSRPLLDGLVLQAGDEVSAASAGTTVRYDDATSLVLGAATRLRLAAPGDGAGKRAWLEGGSLEADVSPQPADRPLVVSTPAARIEVVGTRFTLRHDQGTTRLDLAQGRVRFTRHGEPGPVTVQAGQSVSASLVETAGGDAPPAVYDFEDGIQRPAYRAGTVVAGPPRTGNRFCLAGVASADYPWSVVQFDSGKTAALLPYADDAGVSFDYWIDDRVRSLDLFIWNETQERCFGGFTLRDPVHGAWSRLTVRFADLRCAGEPALRQRVGDRIRQLAVQAGQQGGTLYVDNVRLFGF
jgi:ferric-dicitrate binding protein FerR (iron transport regulator)